MKTYKIITIKQGLTIDISAFAAKVEAELNEKINMGWELVDISWNSFSTGLGASTAFLTFKV